MKIVFANKYYFLKGGAERYFFDLKNLLECHGNEVIPFAMQDARNVKSPWEKYFVSAVQTEKVSLSIAGLKTAGRMLYSFEAKKKFAELLDAAKPNLIHIHNIYHQISPSILPEARKRGIPIVMTAHDYKLIAPNYSLFHDGAICERTKPAKYWNAFTHRCIKGSSAASALSAMEMSLHKSLGLYRDTVSKIIAPSRFMQSLLAEYGIAEEKIVHVPHPIDANAWRAVRGGKYALFVGRLSGEKGVDVLIRAAALRSDIPVHIVGTGPDEMRLKDLARQLGATNVIFKGWLTGGDLRAEYAGASFLVVPSVWYEVFGLIVLEAYAAGKPVIASQIGGLGELVREGETGLLTAPGNDEQLAEKMAEMWAAPELTADMGVAGRAWVEKDFTPEAHLKRMMEVYASVEKK